MDKFIVRRILRGIICMWFIWTFIFILVRLTGDPTDWMLPDGANIREIEGLRATLGLDLPIWKQYINAFTDLLRGNAGISYYFKRDVSLLYAERMGMTLKLAIPGFLLAIVTGISLGTFAAARRNTPGDRVTMSLAIVGYTIPSFAFGIILILIFSLWLRLLPSSGVGSWKNMIMPMLTISVSPMATIARLTRSSLLDTMTKEYLDGARMKGLSETTVIIKHALRNSLIPVVTSVGMQLGTMIGGAVVVENVFSWPGVGTLLVSAAKQRDFPTVQYGILLVATTVTIANILIDVSYGYLDPRIRESFK